MTFPESSSNICQIPADTYPIGNNRIGYSRPEHTVKLAAFALSPTTVTNVQFLGFMAAHGYTTPDYWSEMGLKWLKQKPVRHPGFWDDPLFNQPEQPVVGVTWYEADAFGRWLATATGIPWRLPSEVEWEAAARGVDGDAPLPRLYNTVERGLGHAWAVTEKGNVSWCGARDLCGNVWEWCSTRWGHNWQSRDYLYPYTTDDGRERLDGSDARIIRGGSWFDPLPDADPTNRARYLPGSRASNIGFRLAYTSG